MTRVDGVKAPHNGTPDRAIMFWYSSKVTLESKVFLRMTFMLRFGVRAWAVAMSSAKAVKRAISGFTRSLQQFLCDVWAARVTAVGLRGAYSSFCMMLGQLV